MPVVRIWIDKFASVVLIDSEHPLAVAQRARDAAAPTDTQQASAPAVQDAPAPVAPRVHPQHKKGRR
jgi:hypothetical protein